MSKSNLPRYTPDGPTWGYTTLPGLERASQSATTSARWNIQPKRRSDVSVTPSGRSRTLPRKGQSDLRSGSGRDQPSDFAYIRLRSASASPVRARAQPLHTFRRARSQLTAVIPKMDPADHAPIKEIEIFDGSQHKRELVNKSTQNKGQGANFGRQSQSGARQPKDDSHLQTEALQPETEPEADCSYSTNSLSASIMDTSVRLSSGSDGPTLRAPSQSLLGTMPEFPVTANLRIGPAQLEPFESTSEPCSQVIGSGAVRKSNTRLLSEEEIQAKKQQIRERLSQGRASIGGAAPVRGIPKFHRLALWNSDPGLLVIV